MSDITMPAASVVEDVGNDALRRLHEIVFPTAIQAGDSVSGSLTG